jgi:hypothetical protein
MRAKIIAERTDNGQYRMVCIVRGGIREYPQEGRTHDNRQDVYNDAAGMYRCNIWDYDSRNHTIELD